MLFPIVRANFGVVQYLFKSVAVTVTCSYYSKEVFWMENKEVVYIVLGVAIVALILALTFGRTSVPTGAQTAEEIQAYIEQYGIDACVEKYGDSCFPEENPIEFAETVQEPVDWEEYYADPFYATSEQQDYTLAETDPAGGKTGECLCTSLAVEQRVLNNFAKPKNSNVQMYYSNIETYNDHERPYRLVGFVGQAVDYMKTDAHDVVWLKPDVFEFAKVFKASISQSLTPKSLSPGPAYYITLKIQARKIAEQWKPNQKTECAPETVETDCKDACHGKFEAKLVNMHDDLNNNLLFVGTEEVIRLIPDWYWTASWIPTEKKEFKIKMQCVE